MKKGVKPITQLGVILKLQRTIGSSMSHQQPNFFSWLKILGLRPCKIMLLARLTNPFIRGYATAAQSTWIW
jgi:hypothetical protein